MGTGTGIGRVRGLGSAKHGAHHWLAQRYTAIGNLLLVLWLLFSLIALPGLDYESVVNWIHNPLVAVPLMLMVVSIFMHLRLGMQVMLEDYVHDKGLAFFSMLLPEPLLSAVVLIAFRRRAAFSPVRMLKSPVMRRYWWLPRVRSTWCESIRRGALLTWLTAPPVEPRPNSIDAEPRSSSTRSRLKVSRS